MKRSFSMMRLLGSAVIVGILVGACAPAATPTAAPTDTPGARHRCADDRADNRSSHSGADDGRGYRGPNHRRHCGAYQRTVYPAQLFRAGLQVWR